MVNHSSQGIHFGVSSSSVLSRYSCVTDCDLYDIVVKRPHNVLNDNSSRLVVGFSFMKFIDFYTRIQLKLSKAQYVMFVVRVYHHYSQKVLEDDRAQCKWKCVSCEVLYLIWSCIFCFVDVWIQHGTHRELLIFNAKK